MESINTQHKAIKEYSFDEAVEKHLSREDLLSLNADTAPKFASLLHDLQANIIKPHGKQCALFAFITFQNTMAKRKNLKNWLSELPLTNAMDEIVARIKPNSVRKDSTQPKQYNSQGTSDLMAAYEELLAANKNRSAYRKGIVERGGLNSRDSIDSTSNGAKQLNDLEELKESGAVICFYISHAGYKYFGEAGIAFKRYDDTSAFVKGLAEGTGFGTEKSNIKSEVELGEDNINKYDKVHAMLMVAFDVNGAGRKSLKNKTNEVKEKIEKSISSFGNAFFEIGYSNPKRKKDDDSREWFGFKDGLSNPRFFPTANLEVNPQNIEQPSSLDLVLRPDRGSPNACGSFLVFMKIEQDKVAFENAAVKLAENIFGKKISKDNKEDDSLIEYAAAMLVGRHQDGTPLTLSEKQLYKDSDKDDKDELKKNFNYDDDRLGLKCPFHAHIRKANPREGDHNRRIVRRGMVYGSEHKKEKGILFMSFQGDLEQQFEYIVNQYLFKYDHRGRDVGEDPIVGKGSAYQRYYKKWGKGGESASSPHQPFVTFKGGLYFFAPSISYVKTTLGKNW